MSWTRCQSAQLRPTYRLRSLPKPIWRVISHSLTPPSYGRCSRVPGTSRSTFGSMTRRSEAVHFRRWLRCVPASAHLAQSFENIPSFGAVPSLRWNRRWFRLTVRGVQRCEPQHGSSLPAYRVKSSKDRRSKHILGKRCVVSRPVGSDTSALPRLSAVSRVSEPGVRSVRRLRSFDSRPRRLASFGSCPVR